MAIRRPRRKRQQRNEIRLQACLDKYDDGTYTRIQYLRAVSHSIAHTDSLQLPDGTPMDSDEEASCADTVTALGNGCPLCRTPINMVLRLFA